MKLNCKPENTLAILVGIEQYADPNWPDLGGPAMDALRMANWLLQQGVSPHRIQLYVNFGDAINDDLLTERAQLLAALLSKGVAEPVQPDRANLERALKPHNFPPLAAGETGVLLAYFSGHGLSSSARKSRYVLTSDASSTSWDVVNLNVQADNLRLHEVCRQYPQQWIIQDACAENLGFGRNLCWGSIDLPETSEVAQQYCLFATRPGEFATTNPETQRSDFTNKLLEAIQNNALAQLNIEAVFSRLELEFEKSSAGVNQHPVLSRIGSDWAERSRSPWAKTALGARNALVEILKELPINLNQIHGVFGQITRSEESLPGSIADLVNALDDYHSANLHLSNTDLFALHLATLCARLGAGAGHLATNCGKYQAAQQKLADWVDAWSCQHAGPAVAAEQERLATDQEVGAATPIIVLQPFAEQKVQAWRFCDGDWRDDCLSGIGQFMPVTESTLDQWLVTVIGKVAEKYGIGDKPIIELVLPWRKLFDRYTGLQIEPEPDVLYRLGESSLVLVLRLEERWLDSKWNRPWKNHWQQIKTKLASTAQISWEHAPKAVRADRWQWVGALHSNARSIKKALYEGAPFAVWCAAEDIAFIEEKFTQCNYLEFHQNFQRLGNLRGDDNHIHCLVDDPERVPPGASISDNQLRQPAQRN